MGAERNYARFYGLLKKLPGADKETLVYCTTCGRTTSLREMTSEEYDELCASMEELTGWKVQVKKARSVCLKLMQQAGIDTTDWQRINDFCRHPRIAGKEFARLTLEYSRKLMNMTSREFVKRTMEHIKELTEGLSETEYDNCLEQLSFEIEEERQQLNWSPDIED